MNNWHHTWLQAFRSESHMGEISHFSTLKRGTPTSTTSTRNTRVPEERSYSATETWQSCTSIGRSYGSIVDTLFGTSVIPSGELGQSHTWSMTCSICLQLWLQVRWKAESAFLAGRVCNGTASAVRSNVWIRVSIGCIKMWIILFHLYIAIRSYTTLTSSWIQQVCNILM